MYMSVSAAAAYMGVSPKTVYRLCENRDLPFSRVGSKGKGPKSRISIREKDIDSYMRKNRRMSNAELAELADRKLLEMEAARRFPW